MCQAVLPSEVEIDSYCACRLPNGETMTVKYEYQRGTDAGIRLKGWKRIFVPLSTLSPTAETSLSLPSWWRGFRSYTEIIQFLSRDTTKLVA